MVDSPVPHAALGGTGGPAKRVRGKHVLIIEDDPVNARVLADYLGANGYKITVASNGPDGLAKFDAEHPDLAIIDVLLPRKNGFEVCFAIRRSAHGKGTPVLLMSAVYHDHQHAEQMRAALAAEAFLLKPFDLDVLLGRVRALLGKA
jgi:DNA-binding response OmpR family regulator